MKYCLLVLFILTSVCAYSQTDPMKIDSSLVYVRVDHVVGTTSADTSMPIYCTAYRSAVQERNDSAVVLVSFNMNVVQPDTPYTSMYYLDTDCWVAVKVPVLLNAPLTPAGCLKLKTGIGIEYYTFVVIRDVTLPDPTTGTALKSGFFGYSDTCVQGGIRRFVQRTVTAQVGYISTTGMVRLNTVNTSEDVLPVECTLQFVDLVGRTVHAVPLTIETGTREYMIDPADIPRGMYIAVLIGQDGTVSTPFVRE